LIFDVAVLIAGLVTLGIVPRIGDEVHPAIGGGFLVLAVLTQLFGAWIKGKSLSLRLTGGQGPPNHGFFGLFFNALLFLHFLLFTMITLFSFTLLGFTQLENSEVFFLGWMLAGFLIGGLTTYLVRAAATPTGVSDRLKTGPTWLEYAGDGLLWVSAMIITRVFWAGLMALIQTGADLQIAGWGQGLLLLGTMGILYLFFYLPARYLFLVEDYRSGWTWVQMLAAMLPVVGLAFR
jgi:hypothetical protein